MAAKQVATLLKSIPKNSCAELNRAGNGACRTDPISTEKCRSANSILGRTAGITHDFDLVEG